MCYNISIKALFCFKSEAREVDPEKQNLFSRYRVGNNVAQPTFNIIQLTTFCGLPWRKAWIFATTLFNNCCRAV